MNKLTTISFTALAVLLAGCTEWGNPPFRNAIPTETGPWKADAERISHEDDLKFAPGVTKVSSANGAKLGGLVSKSTLNTPMHVRLIAHTAKGDFHKLTEQRVASLVKCLNRRGGIHPENVEVFYAGETEADRKDVITVALDQYQAIAPKCPGWNEYMNTYGMPEGEAHFGCTTATNVAKMAYDPYDMYPGRRSPAIKAGDGERQVFFVDRYRKGKEEPLKIERVETGR